MSSQSKGRPGGVLPISAAVTKKTNTQSKPAQRVPAPKLRLIIRRLPPGLTESEFWSALGSEWQSGKGKVDWHAFKDGKISKDPSKPSRPGRAYLKVKDQSLLDELSAKVKSTSFKDSKNTSGDSCLVGPPTLEYAPYNKTPSGRNRHDGRQGTIDQDQEFIDFLQSLTEPITKPPTNGTEAGDLRSDKVVITPLVQYIKEKKANKAKEKEAAAAAKSSKKNQEGKEGKESKSKGESRPTVIVKSNAAAAVDKAKASKAAQESIKAVNKSSVSVQGKSTANKTEPKSTKDTAPVTTPAPAQTATPVLKPERQRGSVTAASRMIARDLGLAPKEPRTPRAARIASAAALATAETTPKAELQPKVISPSPAVTPKPSTPAAAPAPTPPTGPKGNRSGQTPQTKPNQLATQRPGKTAPQPSPGAKSAFLKHANPSQGVTEDLLRTTFITFGEVTRCEIDKKKGLGYIDFTDTEALKKAMAASPIKVGNGQVVVLENRSPYQKRQAQNLASPQQAGAATTSSRAPSVASSTVVSAVTSPQPASAVIATIEPPASVTNTPTSPNTTSIKTPSAETSDTSVPQSITSAVPSAPKGGKGGNVANKGARGGTSLAPGRGNPTQSPTRGRGGFRGRGGRGGKAGGILSAAPAASTATPASSAPAPAASQASTSDNTKPAPAEKS